jgi:hypothetical protein
MARFNNPLANVQVAAPCKADWNQMMGDERVRFCSECNLNVYNLSAMTRSDAESLIVRNEGRLCVKFYRRRDGSIITRDCPVGLRAIRDRVSYLTKAIASAVLGFMAGVGVHEAVSSSLTALRPGRTMGVMAERVEPRFDGQDPQVIPDRARQVSVGQLVETGRHRKPKRFQFR